jgi:uncharacterized lipoprotein NlpE involved in copper resistance
MKRLIVGLLAAALLWLAGCSGNSAAVGPSSAPTSETPAAAVPESAPSGAASTAVDQVNECLSGTYRLIRFVGVGDKGTFGTGQGGDVTVSFNDGSYLLQGAGKEPIKLTLAGQTANLFVNGTVSGGYRIAGDQATFTIRQSTGSATLKAGPAKESIPIGEVSNVLAPDGVATVACANSALIVTLQDVRLEFGKI